MLRVTFVMGRNLEGYEVRGPAVACVAVCPPLYRHSFAPWERGKRIS